MRLEIAFHWPHDRLALGWEYLAPDNENDHRTIMLFLFIVTLTIDY